MAIDKSILYAHIWEDSSLIEVGNYTEFSYIFEDDLDNQRWNDNSRFLRVTDLEVMNRYKEAEAAFMAARAAFWETCVPVTEAPTLPPIPDGCVTDDDDRFKNGDWPTPDGGCSCDHWHIHVCDCGGTCTCHKVKGRGT